MYLRQMENLQKHTEVLLREKLLAINSSAIIMQRYLVHCPAMLKSAVLRNGYTGAVGVDHRFARNSVDVCILAANGQHMFHLRGALHREMAMMVAHTSSIARGKRKEKERTHRAGRLRMCSFIDLFRRAISYARQVPHTALAA